MRFAKWVFLLAGVSGILLVVPPYFLERQTGEDYWGMRVKSRIETLAHDSPGCRSSGPVVARPP